MKHHTSYDLKEEEPTIECQVEDAPLKHSLLGNSSFIISLLTGIGLFVFFSTLVYNEMSIPEKTDIKADDKTVLGLTVIGFAFTGLVALGLGIGGLFQKKTYKTFSVLGVIFSLLIVLFFVLIMVIGQKK
jgi:hypothetical protein